MKLKDRVAVITGGGTGIGRAIALAFANEGADIVIGDINLKTAESVVNEVKSSGRQGLAVQVDVSKAAEVRRFATDVIDTFHKVDILVNNAGIDHPCPVLELTEENWDAHISINLKGVYLCSQAFGRQLVKQGQGKIINMASVSAHKAFHGRLAYCASKGGVLMMTKVLALEFARYNINVNALSPGGVMTPLLEGLRLDDSDRLKRIPLGRWNKPEDIASAALFLASSDSDNITGQDIIIDGGVTANFWDYDAPGAPTYDQ